MPGRLRGDERIKHLVEDPAVDPRPIVFDEKLYDSGTIAGANLDATFAAKGVRRVEKQVQE